MKKKMNILFIVSIMPPFAGGAAVDYGLLLNNFARRFEREFMRISVLTEKGCSKDNERIVFRDSLYNYDSASTRSFLKQFVNYLIIIAHIIFTRSDVIHIHARYVYAKYAGRIVWLALILSRARVVVDIRDRFYSNFGFGLDFTVCSGELMSFYHWIKRKEYIPVPLALPPAGKAVPKPHLAYFGSISFNKGVMELIDGYKEYLKERGGLSELHFYGPNAIGEAFERAILEVPSIRYMGIIASEEMVARILGYKAVILPSPSEGMPRVCLETIYSGRIIACHENVRRILPCIPERFVLKDTTPGEFKRVFREIENSGFEISYGYDFKIHDPEEVCAAFLTVYRKTLSGAASERVLLKGQSADRAI